MPNLGKKGSVVVEFAILSPVLLLLICGLTDLGYLYFAQTTLNGAVLQSARLAATKMDISENERNSSLRASIKAAMLPFGAGEPVIRTMVYRKFADSTPEPYIDTNHNGAYDAPSSSSSGEPFTDRNGNGFWDTAQPKGGSGNAMGDIGDVVNYTATLEVGHLFGILGNTSIRLKSTTVVRNEAVKTE